MGFCSKHKSTPLEDVDCFRCRGEGYTDSDIEELDNPASWHDGKCFQCRGTGTLCAVHCPICEEEYQDEEFDRAHPQGDPS